MTDFRERSLVSGSPAFKETAHLNYLIRLTKNIATETESKRLSSELECLWSLQIFCCRSSDGISSFLLLLGRDGWDGWRRHLGISSTDQPPPSFVARGRGPGRGHTHMQAWWATHARAGTLPGKSSKFITRSMHDPLVGANAAGNPTLKSYNMISSSVGSALSSTCFYPFSLTPHR